MDKKILPRHAGGSFELLEGTGSITGMCSFGDFLEIYKMDKTFRVQSPESIDPDQTNPNALWVTTPVSDVGSQNPIISRIILQNEEILKSAWLKQDIDKNAVLKLLHSCKEDLLVCDKIAKKIASEVDRIVSKIQKEGIRKEKNSLGLSSFPHVPDLNTDCDIFLTKSNRVIRAISELPGLFINLPKRDNNFDSLIVTLTPFIEKNSPLFNFIAVNADNIKYIIELRNFREHQNKDKKTVIENFRCSPDIKIVTPQWYVTGGDERPIKEEMEAIVNYLLEVAEAMFIYLVMATVKSEFPFILVKIEDSKIDKKAPIKYRLSLDISKMNLPK